MDDAILNPRSSILDPLPNLSAEFPLQHLDHAVMRGVDLLGGQRPISRAVAQRERDRMFARRQLLAGVDVEEFDSDKFRNPQPYNGALDVGELNAGIN